MVILKPGMSVGNEGVVNKSLPTTMIASIGSKVTVFCFFFVESKNTSENNAPPGRLHALPCTKIGHYAKACQAKEIEEDSFCLCCYADDGSHYVGIQNRITCKLNCSRVQALLDLGCTHSYVDKQGVNSAKIGNSTSLTTSIYRFINVPFSHYQKVRCRLHSAGTEVTAI